MFFRDRRPEIPVGKEPPQRTVADVLEIAPKDRALAPAALKHAHRFKDVKIKIAGFGGQGVLLLGQLLIEMGMREALEVSWLPSYGPEMRSAARTATCACRKSGSGRPWSLAPMCSWR